ncbi:creatininase family protein [Fontibacillus sp. BL9]|uniref:creatininase family protein n=1 Tax=Fontibacillus sp. BL9 TaxID=3389971 RepID=UPI00397CC55D
MTEVCYGNLTYLEIKEKAKQDYIVIIPTGCTEQQGPHTTVDFDTWFAETLMVEATKEANRIHNFKGLVLPTMPFGPTPEHRNYRAGYINIPQSVYEEVIKSIIVSLVEQDFKKFIVWRGCGGHNLDNVINELHTSYKKSIQIYNPRHPFYDVWCTYEDSNIPGGHADSFTTSIGLFKRPESIRHELISNPMNSEPDWGDPELDFTKYSSTGVIGDPTRSSKELGEKLWKETINRVIKIFTELR